MISREEWVDEVRKALSERLDCEVTISYTVKPDAVKFHASNGVVARVNDQMVQDLSHFHGFTAKALAKELVSVWGEE